MGLMSGTNGPKKMLREHFKDAFRDYDTLQHAREATGHQRAETVVLMDGNVAMMGVPGACATFTQYFGVVYAGVRAALRAGRVVVIAFDEPDAVPDAKRAEQARRDREARMRRPQSSVDLTTSVDDSYTQEQLEQMSNVQILKDNRPARVKLYDAVCVAVFHKAVAAMQQWTANGYDAGALVMDGVDMRGAHRRPHEVREPIMVSTDLDLVPSLSRAVRVGEGDMKLPTLERRVRDLRRAKDGTFEQVRLVINATTDTDSLPICVMDAALRRAEPDVDTTAGVMHSLLMMKERSQPNDQGETSGRYTTVDTVMLEDCLQAHMWGTDRHRLDLQPVEYVRSAYALVASCAMPKCDFLKFDGARFDHFLETLPTFVRKERAGALLGFDCVVCDDDQTARQCVSESVVALCAETANHMQTKPRYKKQAELVRTPIGENVARVVWVLGYWAGKERKDCQSFGFDPVPRPPPPPPPQRAPADHDDTGNSMLDHLLVATGGRRDPIDCQYKWDRAPVDPAALAAAQQPLMKRLRTVGAGMGECGCTPARHLPLATRCSVCGRYAFCRSGGAPLKSRVAHSPK